MATVRATVWPIDTDHPARLFHNSGFDEDLGRQHLQHAPTSDGVFDIDDLATDGQPLLAATHALASRLFQEFGQPEALQLTATGEIRRRYWHSWSKEIVAWAGAVGVPLTEETLPNMNEEKPSPLPRRQQVPVLDLHRRTFPQVRYCRGCFVCPAGGTL